MLKKLAMVAAVALSVASAVAWAAGEDLVGLWNVPDGAGTLEIKEGGTFTGTVKGGDDFTGKWKISAEGVLSLVRGDGKTANCKYTLADDVLTLSDCPIPGRYERAQ